MQKITFMDDDYDCSWKNFTSQFANFAGSKTLLVVYNKRKASHATGQCFKSLDALQFFYYFISVIF